MIVESAVDRYLRELAGDSDRWQRLGRRGTENFVDGLLDGLTRVGAISRDEASTWSEVFLRTFSDSPARFRSAAGALSSHLTPTPGVLSQFIELVPAHLPAKELSTGGSLQILGVERYDVKVAIMWRMVARGGWTVAHDASTVASLGTGFESQSIRLTDDRGTSYQRMGGSSAGRVERVGRSEFRPAAPDDATTLRVEWEGLVFEVALGANS